MRTRKVVRIDEKSFGDTCPLCKEYIEAAKIMRVDGVHCRCPHCCGEYEKPIARGWSQLGN